MTNVGLCKHVQLQFSDGVLIGILYRSVTFKVSSLLDRWDILRSEQLTVQAKITMNNFVGLAVSLLYSQVHFTSIEHE